jgi:KaiC/GvpD/RAD55 family RecA-like ATPase
MLKVIPCNKPDISKIKFECDDEIHPKLNEYPLTRDFFNKSNTTVFLGRPSSGKTSLMINFVQKIYRKKFHKIYLFMPETSRKSLKNNIFEKYLPPDQIYEELTIDSIADLYEKIKANSMEGYKSLVIFDDVQRALRDYDIVKMVKNLFANRRHLKIVVFVMLQNYFALDKSLRDLIDNVILFKMNKNEQLKVFDEIIEAHKDKFEEIQHLVFSEKYNWLFVNIESQRMFKGFDEIVTTQN